MNDCRLNKIRSLATAGLISVSLAACTVTPIDAVTELDGTGSTGSSTASGTSATGSGGNASTGSTVSGTGVGGLGAEGPPGTGICEASFVPAPGEYHIMSASTGMCMAAGEVTPIQGAATATGYEVLLEPCSAIDGQLWDLSPRPVDELTGVIWRVEVRNVELDLNLDMEGADPYDGTRALLYNPHSMENQRFEFLPNGDDRYMISPMHVDNACLQAMSEGIPEMWGCDLTDADQQWQLASEDCLE